jgi:dTDP-4-amino-4,6-dideoxy-D-galactose acyltransferase
MSVAKIEKLEWDSQFFGYPVAKVEIFNESLGETKLLFRQIKKEKFRLCYFFVKPENKAINNFIHENGGILIDKKTTLFKKTENHISFFNDIVEIESLQINNDLKTLALIAGSFSRFKLDRNFEPNEFERLYTEWISKSLKKEFAIKTFIAEEYSKAIGLITLAQKDNIASIGLVAVNENYLGRKIGSDLVRKVDSVAFSLGFETIQVATQFQNIAAIKLYEKCNFKIENITNIYHLWNK